MGNWKFGLSIGDWTLVWGFGIWMVIGTEDGDLEFRSRNEDCDLGLGLGIGMEIGIEIDIQIKNHI